jgi:hypothetical protein
MKKTEEVAEATTNNKVPIDEEAAGAPPADAPDEPTNKTEKMADTIGNDKALIYEESPRDHPVNAPCEPTNEDWANISNC